MPNPLPPLVDDPSLTVAHRPVTDGMAGFLRRLETRQRECAMGLMGLLGLIKSARVGVRGCVCDRRSDRGKANGFWQGHG